MNALTATVPAATARVDLLTIAELVTPGSRVLDIGCGDGALLQLLEATRQVDGRGIELSQRGVNECVARGLSVVQGDADTDLADYPDGGFDFVILSQTLQATHRPRHVVEEMLQDRGQGDRLLPELRALEGARPARSDRAHAGHPQPPLLLVRHAQHPLLHHPRFRRAVRRGQCEGGNQDRVAPRWRAASR